MQLERFFSIYKGFFSIVDAAAIYIVKTVVC